MSDLFDLFGPRVYVISETAFKEYEESIKKKKVERIDEQVKYYENIIQDLKKKRETLVS